MNLSRSGVLLETPPVAIGTRVRVGFQGLEASGTVVREISAVGSAKHLGAAVRFDEVQQSGRWLVG